MIILLDTGFLFALKIKNDKYHYRAISLANEFDWDAHNFITSSLVVNETYTLINARTRGNNKALKDLDQLFWEEDRFFRIIHFVEDDYIKISEILYKNTSPKRVLSFVDASLIYLKHQMNIDSIISFDEHFDNLMKRIF